ncbi:MAG: hypothetical protein HY819_10510 [Acidobacteria bacterium]|nr:hypothetical protein [Acidobacteriota bacterium]
MYKYLLHFFLFGYFFLFFYSTIFAQIKDYGTLVIKTTSPKIEIISPKNQYRIDEITVVVCLKEGRSNISWKQNEKVESKGVEIKTGQVTAIEIGKATGQLSVLVDRPGVLVEAIGYEIKESKYAGEKLTFNNLKLIPTLVTAKINGRSEIKQVVNITDEKPNTLNVGWEDATLDVSFDRPNVEFYINNRLEATSSSSGQIITLRNISSGIKKLSALAIDPLGHKYLIDVEPKEINVEANKTYAINLSRKDAQLSVTVDRANIEVVANGVTLISEKANQELLFPLMLPDKVNLTAKFGRQQISKEIILQENQVTKENIGWNDAMLVITVDRPNVDILVNKILLATSRAYKERLILKNLKPGRIFIEGLAQSLGNNFYALEASPQEFDLAAGQTIEVTLSKKDAQLIVTTDRQDAIELLLNNQIQPLKKVGENVYYFPFMSPGRAFISAKLKEKPLFGEQEVKEQIELPAGQTPIEIAWRDLFLLVEIEPKVINLKVNNQEGVEVSWKNSGNRVANKKVYLFPLKPHETAEITWEIEGKRASSSSFIIRDFTKSQGITISNRRLVENN